ncbi:MAG TPA: glycoside hydrolase family 38 C-terminal domain-containing protein [Candidatus Hydrogenedentes bacterium]|nr:glycoside hydrolase family 38 C-terminal domain-containing protein [Candidatus Hydrogenedentota bacterium]HOL75806.1 glycoside hydrolase family 38 C-terminal domain-containing protein [Candidatus Hydrogenedentota bacterium]HPO87189.1 glycoside hydrolase family 38 C-terminal domain-containing protein [Candidatus Hydrogenedentota bacterium]
MQKVHLVCNAHLDPVWLWEWQEGVAEALSTFRTAADLCEEFDGFIFNHNEALLYLWIERHDPGLFRRIQDLVRRGKWHIMGGWYLQPDCNMPSGESFVRQALVGKRYFLEKFGVEPRTAINFDPFGHSRGLVQILKKSGYDSYLHCRPGNTDCPLPDADYLWVGFDGSEIYGHRTLDWYGTPQFGKARQKVEDYLKANDARQLGIILWGVGNHGGGPSRKDLEDLRELIEERRDVVIVHSVPENYFSEIQARPQKPARHEEDLNPWAVGCYTSQIRVKQRHRLLENELYSTEKMVSAAALQQRMEYPKEAFGEALRDLLMAEFHDILPGSSIQPVEEAALRLLDHGIEILARIKAQAFFALAQGEPKAKEKEIPILAYNPHPFPVTGVFECEFNLPDATFDKQFTMPIVHLNGVPVPCQTEKELSNVNLDWRKRCVFYAELKPSQVTRFDCSLKVLPERPTPSLQPHDGKIVVNTDVLSAEISCKTGLLEKYAVNGTDFIQRGAFQAIVMEDNEDPWGMLHNEFHKIAGKFRLASPKIAAWVAGLEGKSLEPVRVIEDGPVRSVVEAIFTYHCSFLVLRYHIPKQGGEIEIHVRVHWNEKDKLLKLAVPVRMRQARYLGQVAYGRDELPGDKREVVAQKWVAAISDDHALTLINDGVYGSDFYKNAIRVSLLRSPAYAGHPIDSRPIVPQDRYTPRHDQGERFFRFWLQGGKTTDRLNCIEREALVHNETPFLLSFYPSGMGSKPLPGILLDDEVVVLTAFKQCEDGEDYIVRLFEPTGESRATKLTIPPLGICETILLNPFEIKSLRVDVRECKIKEVDLIERPVTS